jgi:hypothetical protein
MAPYGAYATPEQTAHADEAINGVSDETIEMRSPVHIP